jgi:outer membrane protein OmpA-like peptidoglycan-associated protein
LFVCWTLAAAGDGFDLEMFHPNIFGGNFVSVEDARTLPQLGFGFGLYYDYATSLLTFFENDEPKFDGVSSLNGLRANAALGLTDWWSLGVQAPAFSLRYRELPDPQRLDRRGELQNSDLVFGDLMAEMKFRALVQDKHWLGMAIAPFGRFPTGDSDRLVGEGRVTGGGRLMLDHDFGPLTVALNGGYLFRGEKNNLFGAEMGDAVLYGAGISKVFDFGFGLGLEYFGRSYQVADRQRVFGSPMELALFLQYKFGARGPRLVGGCGAGLSSGVGAPPYRVVGGIDYFYTPPETGALMVRTRDEQGLPLAAEVTIIDAQGRRSVARSEGDVQLDLPPGAYTASASPAGREAASQQAEVRRGATVEVVLNLPKIKEPETVAVLTAVDKCTGEKIEATLTLDDGAKLELSKQGLRQSMTPGSHRGSLAAPGYTTRQVEIRLEKGKAVGVKLWLAKPSKLVKSGKILFAEGSSQLSAAALPTLDDLAQQIRRLCDYKTIVIEGHADDVESKAKSQQLSEDRANAVVKHLTEKGVDPAKLKAIGFGATRPIASNAVAWGREQNRRIEVRIEE